MRRGVRVGLGAFWPLEELAGRGREVSGAGGGDGGARQGIATTISSYRSLRV